MSPSQTSPTNWLLYVSLIVATAIGPLALNMFVPSIPGLVSDLSTTPAMAQSTLTLYLAGTAVSQLVYGPLSDRFGRRPVLLAGICLFVAASIWCALSSSIEGLISARLVQSFGGAAGMVLTRAIVRDMHDEKSGASVLGYITMAWAVAPMVAPAIGGYLDGAAGWRASFWVLALFGSIALAMVSLSLPETNNNRENNRGQSRLAGYKRLLGNAAFMWLVATLAFTSGVFFAFLGGAPFIMIDILKQSPFAYGVWFSVVAIGYMAGNFISGRFSRTTDTSFMITIGIAIAAIAACVPFIAGLTGSLSPALLFIPTGFMALGNGITLPNATSATLSTDPKAMGSAAGLAGFVQSLSGAGVAQLVGILQPVAPLVALYMMAACAVLSGVCYLLYRRCHQL